MTLSRAGVAIGLLFAVGAWYDGSLTTPPCTEGVQWIVLATPIELDAQQIDAFTRLIHDNSRPPQPLHQRAVVSDSVH